MVWAISIVSKRRITVMTKHPKSLFGIILLLQPKINTFSAKNATVLCSVVVHMVNSKKLHSVFSATGTLTAISHDCIMSQFSFVAFRRFIHLFRTYLISFAYSSIDTVLVLLAPLALILTGTFFTIGLTAIWSALVTHEFASRKFPFTSCANLCVFHGGIIPHERSIHE